MPLLYIAIGVCAQASPCKMCTPSQLHTVLATHGAYLAYTLAAATCCHPDVFSHYPPCIMQGGASKDKAREAQLLFENRRSRAAVRHVVLAVHGIGQRMGGRTIAEDARDVRERANRMLDEHMPAETGLGFVQVLPVQWRKNLDLEVRTRTSLSCVDECREAASTV